MLAKKASAAVVLVLCAWALVAVSAVAEDVETDADSGVAIHMSAAVPLALQQKERRDAEADAAEDAKASGEQLRMAQSFPLDGESVLPAGSEAGGVEPDEADPSDQPESVSAPWRPAEAWQTEYDRTVKQMERDEAAEMAKPDTVIAESTNTMTQSAQCLMYCANTVGLCTRENEKGCACAAGCMCNRADASACCAAHCHPNNQMYFVYGYHDSNHFSPHFHSKTIGDTLRNYALVRECLAGCSKRGKCKPRFCPRHPKGGVKCGACAAANSAAGYGKCGPARRHRQWHDHHSVNEYDYEDVPYHHHHNNHPRGHAHHAHGHDWHDHAHADDRHVVHHHHHHYEHGHGHGHGRARTRVVKVGCKKCRRARVRQTEYDGFDSWGHLHHYVDRHTELNTNQQTVIHTERPVPYHAPWYAMAETEANANDADADADADADTEADADAADQQTEEADEEADGAEAEGEEEAAEADAEGEDALVETGAATDKPARIRMAENVVAVNGQYGRHTHVHIDPERAAPIRRYRSRPAHKHYSAEGESLADNGPVDFRQDVSADAFPLTGWADQAEPTYAAGHLNPAVPYVYQPEARTVTFSTAPHDVMQQEAQAKIVITN